MPKKTGWIMIFAVIVVVILSAVITYLINRPDCESENRVIPNSLDNITDTVLNVPLNIVLASGESNRVSYDNTKIQAMAEYSNEIWRGAGITFYVASVKNISVPDWRATPLQKNGILCQFGKEFLGSDFEDGMLDVIFVKDFLFSSGGLTLNQGIIAASFVEEFEDEYRANWTLAHELGHAMNLNHVGGRNNLMFNANEEIGILTDRPTNLTQQQIDAARQWIYLYHCPALSCIRD